MVLAGNTEPSASVTSAAVIASNGDRGVYLVGQDRTARFQPLTLGLESDGWIEVSSGLDADAAQIVVDGHKQLSDGARVDVQGK